MASRPLHRIRAIDEETCGRLAAVGITTVRDLLATNPLRLMAATNSSFDEVHSLLLITSDAVKPDSISVLSLLRQRASRKRFLKTGVSALDTALHGGLLLGTVTDICGQPGVGKTQLCMMSAIEAALQSQGVVYIDTEQKFDPTRLVHIATHAYPAVYSPQCSTDAAHHVDRLLQLVSVHRPKTTAEFAAVVDQLQVQAIESKVGLVVVDSIAALLKQEALDEAQREKFIMAQSSALKHLADSVSCAVLCTNQVAPALHSEGGDVYAQPASALDDPSPAPVPAHTPAHTPARSGGASSNINMTSVFHSAIATASGLSYLPALGATWHHCVTTRLTLASSHGALGGGGQAGVVEGVLSVTKSPLVACCSLPYSIGLAGIVCPAQ